jgi:heme A synthase
MDPHQANVDLYTHIYVQVYIHTIYAFRISIYYIFKMVYFTKKYSRDDATSKTLTAAMLLVLLYNNTIIIQRSRISD